MSTDEITEAEKSKQMAELDSQHKKQEEVLIAQLETQSTFEMEKVVHEIDQRMLTEISKSGTETMNEVNVYIESSISCGVHVLMIDVLQVSTLTGKDASELQIVYETAVEQAKMKIESKRQVHTAKMKVRYSVLLYPCVRMSLWFVQLLFCFGTDSSITEKETKNGRSRRESICSSCLPNC